jgi:hypothetical protein
MGQLEIIPENLSVIAKGLKEPADQETAHRLKM